MVDVVAVGVSVDVLCRMVEVTAAVETVGTVTMFDEEETDADPTAPMIVFNAGSCLDVLDAAPVTPVEDMVNTLWLEFAAVVVAIPRVTTMATLFEDAPPRKSNSSDTGYPRIRHRFGSTTDAQSDGSIGHPAACRRVNSPTGSFSTSANCTTVTDCAMASAASPAS